MRLSMSSSMNEIQYLKIQYYWHSLPILWGYVARSQDNCSDPGVIQRHENFSDRASRGAAASFHRVIFNVLARSPDEQNRLGEIRTRGHRRHGTRLHGGPAVADVGIRAFDRNPDASCHRRRHV